MVGTREIAQLSEADLWERYVRGQDEAAFETLVRRHGPMVLGVCRRILRNEQDAEDAFQATFLVLIRRAASLRSPCTIANWLYGVARRTALEARRTAAKRREKEAAVPPRMVLPENACDDLWPSLDQELGRLAEKYRTPVLLCDLEGKTRKEVAQEVGWAEGTVASRLARGRRILAKRLARRGFAGALVTAALADGAPSACPPALVASMARAMSFSTIEAAATKGVLSSTVVALTKGVLKSMLRTKIKSAVTVLLISGIATLGVGGLISAYVLADGKAPLQARPEEVQRRIAEMKQQLQHMNNKLAQLERESASPPDERKSGAVFPTDRLRYRIAVEIGQTETKEGGRIEIKEVWGTRPRIEIGGQYLVRGTYVLPPGERGRLYFYETATGGWGRTPTADLDLQSMTLDKEKGEFALLHGMAGPGYFHLYLASPDRYSRMFANVYFGTTDNVLRKTP
jgi:RNA polymerase sigma factor (sigma-70 family)